MYKYYCGSRVDFVNSEDLIMMNLSSRQRGAINQVVLEQSFDRLVRESPIPQVLYRDERDTNHQPYIHHYKTAAKTSHSVQVVPKHHYVDPFRSPPPHLSRVCHEDANQSIADIFKSLKTSASDRSQGQLSGGYDGKFRPDDTSYKENTQNVNNISHPNVIAGNTKGPLNSFHQRSKGPQALYSSHGLVSRNIQSEKWQHGPQHLHHPVHKETRAGRVDDDEALEEGIQEGSNQETFREAFGGQTNNEKGKASQHEDDADMPELADTAQVLHQWIIRPIPECKAICVEGKRSLLDQEFWHTGVVTQRLSDRMVATHSGSIYRLVGNMELFDALAEGFSHQMCEAFWLGFPEDWETLVKQHYSKQPGVTSDSMLAVQQTGKDMAKMDKACDIATLPGDELNAIETTGDNSHCDEDSEDLTMTEVDMDHLASPGKGVEPIPDNMVPAKMQSTDKREITLANWVIKNVEETLGVYVIGNKENGMLWHSNEIEKRLSNRKLQTISGSVYILKGTINHLLALDADLPEEIIKKFKNGFPKDWQECIQEHFGPRFERKQTQKKLHKKDKNSVNEKSSATKSERSSCNKRERNKRRMSEPPSKKSKISSKSFQSDLDQKLSKSEKKAKPPVNKSKKTKSNIHNSHQTQEPSTPDTVNRSVILANGQMANLDSLGRSRSGRLVKPPMQWWTGQHLRTDGDKVIVSTVTAYASEYLKEIEDGYRRSRTKIGYYFNPASGSRDNSVASSRSSVSESVPSASDDDDSTSRDKGNKKQEPKRKSLEEKQNNTIEIVPETSNDNLEEEINDVLKKAKEQRGKIVKHKRRTCYSEEVQAGDRSGEKMYDLDDTLENVGEGKSKTEEMSATVRRTSRRIRNQTVEKDEKKTVREHCDRDSNEDVSLEQENIVSSSTGNLTIELEDCIVEKQTNKADNSKGANVEVDKTNSVVRSTRSGKRLSIIETDSDSENEKHSGKRAESENKSRKPVTKMSVKRTENRAVKSTEKVAEDSQASQEWTQQEKKLLSLACLSIDLNHPKYWELVAKKVGTKSVDSCKQMAFLSDDKKVSSTKKKKKEKPKATALTANVGTLKRQKQLRELLEQHDKSYSDELFESTPFRSRRKCKMDLGDDVFEELAHKQGRKYETPVVAGMKGTRSNIKFASTKKTPSVNNKNNSKQESAEDEETYAFKLQKRLMASKRQQKKAQSKPTVETATGPDKSPQINLFNVTIPEVKGVIEEEDEQEADSDQEDDYYWNDVQ